MKRCGFVVGCLLIALVTSSASRAQPEQEPLEAVVRIADPDDRLLLERVRGQTNDLSVQLETSSGEPLEPSLGAQLDRARQLTAERHARVVVWFVHEDRAITVFVSEPGAGRVLVRRIEHQQDKLATSAQQEAAALVVRTAMRALAHGGEIGVAEREVAPPPPEEPAPEEEDDDAPIPPPPAPLPRGWEVTQHLGERAAWDGVGELAQHALFGRFVLRYRAFQAEMRASLGWPEKLDDGVARVRLLRHSASLHAAWLPFANEAWTVSTAVGAGVNLFVTDVDARAGSTLSAKDELLPVAVVSGDVTVRLMPAWARRRFGFACLLGADLLPAAPSLGYDDGKGRFVRRDRLWNVLPTAALEIVIRMR